jgi:hypothetical protein
MTTKEPIIAGDEDFVTYRNNGSEGGLTNQCMLISILDHLRNISHSDLTDYGINTVADFRTRLNITQEQWGEHSEFCISNMEKFIILKAISENYKINIYIRYFNRDNSTGREWIGLPHIIPGLRHNADWTDIYIVSYGWHFELLDQPELYNKLNENQTRKKKSKSVIQKEFFSNGKLNDHIDLINMVNKEIELYTITLEKLLNQDNTNENENETMRDNILNKIHNLNILLEDIKKNISLQPQPQPQPLASASASSVTSTLDSKKSKHATLAIIDKAKKTEEKQLLLSYIARINLVESILLKLDKSMPIQAESTSVPIQKKQLEQTPNMKECSLCKYAQLNSNLSCEMCDNAFTFKGGSNKSQYKYLKKILHNISV